MELFSFTDSGGVVWTVREEGADDPPGIEAVNLSGTTWLRFESELEVRRLWHYPDDWRWLNPVQLEWLLDRASTVIARFRPVRHREADRVRERPESGAELSSLRASPASRATPDDRARPRGRSDDPDG